MARERALPLAGGTDIYPFDAARATWGEPPLEHRADPALLDLGALRELDRIERHPDRIEIGALVRWATLRDEPLPAWFDALRQAAREIGGVQIQNRATLAGNLCNASPAADGAPVLLALDARVRLQSRRGRRELPLAAFLEGNRRTVREPDELLTHIVVPQLPEGTRSVFAKLGARRHLVISIVSLAVAWRLDPAGRIADLRVAVGACAPVPVRLRRLEGRALGERPRDVTVEPDDLADLAPIDDIRATAAYRLEAVAVLLRRALLGA